MLRCSGAVGVVGGAQSRSEALARGRYVGDVSHARGCSLR